MMTIPTDGVGTGLGGILGGGQTFGASYQVDERMLARMSNNERIQYELDMQRQMAQQMGAHIAESLQIKTVTNAATCQNITHATVTVPDYSKGVAKQPPESNKDRLDGNMDWMSESKPVKLNWKEKLRKDVDKWLVINVN